MYTTSDNSSCDTVTNMKKLEAAHHKWQRRILGVIWRDKVSNETRQTGMAKLEKKEKAEMAGACLFWGDNNKEKAEMTDGACS